MHTFKHKKISLLVSLSLGAAYGVTVSSAHAADPALQTEAVEVVSTTPLPGVGLPIEQIPAGVQVAKGKDIQDQHGLSLADYMNQNMAGVNINEAQNNPYQPDVNFRGFTASPLLGTPQGLSVYQDGVRINEPFGDTVNWDLIPQNAISGIALMPGSNPLFGLNTLGGALSVTTKSGNLYPGGGIQAYTGSWGRRAAEGEYGGKLDNGVNYFFAVNKFREDGWRDASPTDVKQGFGKLGWSDDKTEVDLSLTLADTDLTGNGFQAGAFLDTFGYDSIYTKPDNTQNKLNFVNGKVSRWLSDEVLLTANAYYRYNRTSTLNGDANDEYEALFEACDGLGLLTCETLYGHGVVNRTRTNSKGYGAALQLTWATEKNQLIGGLSYDGARTRFRQTEEGALAFNAARGLTGLDGASEDVNDLRGRSTTWSLFATDTYAITPALALTVSGRYNHTRIKNRDNLAGQKEGTCIDALGATQDCLGDGTDTPVGGAIVSVAPSQDISSDSTYTRFNPAVGLAYSFSDNLNLYGGYNEGNRAPSPIETGCSDPASPCLLPNAMAGDPPLKQVVAKTFEGGLRGKLGSSFRWTAGAYHTTNHDDLQFIASGTTGAGFFDNVGKTRRKGFDLGIGGDLGDFRWSAGYSYVKATYETQFDMASQANSTRHADASGNDVITVSKGDRIPGIPAHQFKLRGEWRAVPDWVIGANVVAYSDQYARGNENNAHHTGAFDDGSGNVALGKGKIGGYTVVNLDTRYTFANSGWQLFAKVNNVFDREYYTSGLLGENVFDATGAFATDPDNGSKDTFLAPGAPRAGWIGLRYEFGGAKGSSAARVDND